MYARLQTTPRIPSGPGAGAQVGMLLDTIAGHPGFRGVYPLQALGTVTGHLLTLWERAEDAEQASNRTRAQLGAPPVEVVHVYDRVLEVADAWSGPAAGETPAAALVLFFDGPLNDAQSAALRRAHTERILPAGLAVPGIGNGWMLVDAERRSTVIVCLATSVEALEAASSAILATGLLPGEDPALLPMPDRVEACRVAGARVAAAPVG